MRLKVRSPKIGPSYFVAETSILSGFQIMNAIPLMSVIKVLNKHQISFVLTGAHAIASWTKSPRATKDVDVVVAARHQRKAVKALLASFSQLVSEDHEVVIRLRDPATTAVAIDIMKTNQPLFKAAFKNSVALELDKQKCRIPSLEMALAMKFAPMISLVRADEKKHLDAHDFIAMVKVNPNIDLAKLEELGELVYPGGAKKIVKMVDQVLSNALGKSRLKPLQFSKFFAELPLLPIET